MLRLSQLSNQHRTIWALQLSEPFASESVVQVRKLCKQYAAKRLSLKLNFAMEILLLRTKFFVALSLYIFLNSEQSFLGRFRQNKLAMCSFFTG